MRAKFDNGAWRPLIEVTLTMNGVSQQVWMMVDTGADRTTIPPDLAKAVTGMDPALLGDAGPPIRGMGNKVTASRVTDATIAYRGRSLDIKIWSRHNADSGPGTKRLHEAVPLPLLLGPQSP